MSGTRRIWDISQVLRPGLPVWPGDTPFALERVWDMARGAPVNVARATMSTHAGTHGDAPLHYAPGAADSAACTLEPYLGECLVVDARHAAGRVEPGDLPPLGGARRVLLRTFDRFPRDRWVSDFTAIAPATIAHLAAAGVVLIGTDAPSLDPENSQEMAAHQAVLAADMRILEGLVLDDVPPGPYELIALPLPIAGADASPVRAVLRELP